METIQDRLTQALDEALEMTFPASDPIAVTRIEPGTLTPINSRALAGRIMATHSGERS